MAPRAGQAATFDRVMATLMNPVEVARRRSWRGPLLLLAAWLSFALLQTLVSRFLSPEENWRAELPVNLAVALFWAAVSLPVAAYHARVRATRRGTGWIVGAHTPVLIIVALTATVVIRLAWRVLAGAPGSAPFLRSLTYYVDLEVVSYVAIVAVAEMLLALDALRERERLAARLETLLVRARLDFLEAQLQPHCLFNALGAVSELAYEAPAAATRVLRALISIIRGALSTRSDEVTLGNELLAIEPYLDIQRIRFADWLRIEYDVDDGAIDCLVPRFVLQPLVENAIRHGLTGRVAAGVISITARRHDDTVVVRVVDNGVGLGEHRGTAGYGIGLSNVRERLAALYGDGNRLRLFNDAGGGTVAELTLRRRMRDEVRPPVEGEGVRGVGTLETSLSAAADADTAPALTTPVPRGRQVATTTLVVWLACGLLWSQQSFAYLAVRHRLAERAWTSVVANDMVSALIWMAFTPLVFLATTRLPIRRPHLVPRILTYVIGGALIALLHPLLLQRIVDPRGPLSSGLYQGTVIVDVGIVCVLVAVGHRRQLLGWLRDREVAALALSAEVQDARARAARLQAVSPLLLQALERIAAIVRTEPARADQLIARLADYLRLAIECGGAEAVTAERELALSQCLSRLEGRGGFVLQYTRDA